MPQYASQWLTANPGQKKATKMPKGDWSEHRSPVDLAAIDEEPKAVTISPSNPSLFRLAPFRKGEDWGCSLACDRLRT